jgi:hypothetical protein
MSHTAPSVALSGARTGHICDRCNRRLRTGDVARAYATHYDDRGWTLRRVWCEACGDATISRGTDDADEVLVEAVFWKHRLVSIELLDQSRPVAEGQRCR